MATPAMSTLPHRPLAKQSLAAASLERSQTETRDDTFDSALRDGALPAFDAMAREFQGPLLHFLIRRLGNRALAEDVLQETFVKAYRYRARFNPNQSARTWLFTIARREAISHHRRSANERCAQAADPAPASETVALRTFPPSHRVEHEERREQVWSAARQVLTSAEFDALWMTYVEALELAEVARVIGKTRLATRVMLHRARRRLAPFVAKWSTSAPKKAGGLP